MTDAITTYCNCMEDVKRRIAVIQAVVGGASPLGREDFDGELVCLHLRKVLEQIAFASLSAHKDAYAQAHVDFALHWNAKRLLKKLEKVHPNFYPRPVKVEGPDTRGVKHLVDLTDGFLTRDDFEFLYDKASEALHVWNPFKASRQVVNFERSIAEWTTRICSLLNEHWIRLYGSEDVWFVQMVQPEDGKVHAYYSQAMQIDALNTSGDRDSDAP